VLGAFRWYRVSEKGTIHAGPSARRPMNNLFAPEHQEARHAGPLQYKADLIVRQQSFLIC
jgi:hypothetical protein